VILVHILCLDDCLATTIMPQPAEITQFIFGQPLSAISGQVAANAHAVVILDRAGWHRSQALVIPANVTLLELPPYSPELNPVERIWHYLRSHWLANTVFISLADVMDACEMA